MKKIGFVVGDIVLHVAFFSECVEEAANSHAEFWHFCIVFCAPNYCVNSDLFALLCMVWYSIATPNKNQTKTAGRGSRGKKACINYNELERC